MPKLLPNVEDAMRKAGISDDMIQKVKDNLQAQYGDDDEEMMAPESTRVMGGGFQQMKKKMSTAGSPPYAG